MNCDEVRPLLNASLDGESDLVRQVEVDAHLRGCPRCAQLAANLRARNAALRHQLPRFTAPAGLAARVQQTLAAEAASVPAAPTAAPASTRAPEASATPGQPAEPRRPATLLGFPTWRFTGLAASIALAMLVGYNWGASGARRTRLYNEAIGEHVRSLQASHLLDVVSTDQHTVKPWFDGKLDFSPPVVDLAAAGFPLAGGRLDHLDHRTAAALVYHRRLHPINLFVWPANGDEASERTYQRDGYTAESWSHGGLNYLAVSEIPRADLDTFIHAYRSATEQ
ncbi:MAG TPA: zf-HC2 domain-containing protein [Opitutaceae bacterium]|nr:zf-HC2 domain-containing protein [Opitutaceae bacterium]